jgi:GNAT superfamily N-acetyltransferase
LKASAKFRESRFARFSRAQPRPNCKMPRISLLPSLLARSDIDLPEIQAFDCGDAIWARLAANWLKCKDEQVASAVSSIEKYGTEVWLYRSESLKLVGFCALGESRWTIAGIPSRISIVPQFAIQNEYQGQPKDGTREDRFSVQILGDIIHKARLRGTPMLALEVHEENLGAIKLYTNVGFKELPDRKKPKQMRMVFLL